MLKHESTRTQLTPQRRYVSPPTHIQQQRAATPFQLVHVHPQVPDTMTETATLGQITQPAVAHASARKSPTLSTHQLLQTAASDSESARDQAPSTAETVTETSHSESETTNREFATIAAPTPTKAASVPDRTGQTPATSSTSKSLCDHAQNRITKLMIEALWKDGPLPSPAPNDRLFLNRNRPESEARTSTPTSTTSVMTTPSEAAKVPSLSHSRLIRGSSSHAIEQSIHGSSTGLYHHYLSAEVSAQHPTAMDKNNNVRLDSSVTFNCSSARSEMNRSPASASLIQTTNNRFHFYFQSFSLPQCFALYLLISHCEIF